MLLAAGSPVNSVFHNVLPVSVLMQCRMISLPFFGLVLASIGFIVVRNRRSPQTAMPLCPVSGNDLRQRMLVFFATLHCNGGVSRVVVVQLCCGPAAWGHGSMAVCDIACSGHAKQSSRSANGSRHLGLDNFMAVIRCRMSFNEFRMIWFAVNRILHVQCSETTEMRKQRVWRVG